MVVSWQDFEQAQPALADFGKKRIDGKVAYLATNTDVCWGADRFPKLRPTLKEALLFYFTLLHTYIYMKLVECPTPS